MQHAQASIKGLTGGVSKGLVTEVSEHTRWISFFHQALSSVGSQQDSRSPSSGATCNYSEKWHKSKFPKCVFACVNGKNSHVCLPISSFYSSHEHLSVEEDECSVSWTHWLQTEALIFFFLSKLSLQVLGFITEKTWYYGLFCTKSTANFPKDFFWTNYWSPLSLV